VPYLHVHDLNARLKPRVIRARVPVARLTDHIAQSVDWETTPATAQWQTPAARSRELKEQRLLTTILDSDHVRAHLAMVILIGGQDLMPVDYRSPNDVIYI
jgi:hypothetical protein